MFSIFGLLPSTFTLSVECCVYSLKKKKKKKNSRKGGEGETGEGKMKKLKSILQG